MEILLASTNAGKLAEFERLLADVPGYTFRLAPPLEIEETGDTFAANAILKAETTLRLTGQAALADDSGLAVEALDGRPGVYSARYAPTEAERISKLLAELAGVPAARRGASFVCAIALARPNLPTIVVEGRCDGVIADTPRGTGGFGYDPVFLVPELGRTFGELTPVEKNKLGHRGRAATRLVAALLGRL